MKVTNNEHSYTIATKYNQIVDDIAKLKKTITLVGKVFLAGGGAYDEGNAAVFKYLANNGDFSLY